MIYSITHNNILIILRPSTQDDMSNRFQGKNVLITGAASGIGKVTAELFSKEGARVFLADVQEDSGQEVTDKILKTGGKASFLKADVSDFEQVKELVTKAVESYGGIDIAINNAGIGGPMAPVDTMPIDEYQRVININQNGVFYCMNQEIQVMKKQGSGVIVNVASMAGLMGSPFTSAYVASKHAVVGMTKTAALELAKSNIRVNAVCPAFTITPLVTQLFELGPDYEEKLKKAMPMNRYGKPEEIAEAIVFLSSDQSSFSTGLCLPIDGGLSA